MIDDSDPKCSISELEDFNNANHQTQSSSNLAL